MDVLVCMCMCARVCICSSYFGLGGIFALPLMTIEFLLRVRLRMKHLLFCGESTVSMARVVTVGGTMWWRKNQPALDRRHLFSSPHSSWLRTVSNSARSPVTGRWLHRLSTTPVCGGGVQCIQHNLLITRMCMSTLLVSYYDNSPWQQVSMVVACALHMFSSPLCP